MQNCHSSVRIRSWPHKIINVKIKKIIKEEIKRSLSEFGILDEEVELINPPKMEMGDLAFPCFKLSKILKKSPKDIAEEFEKIFSFLPEKIKKVEAKDGYLNFFFERNFFLEEVLDEVLGAGDGYGYGRGEKFAESEVKKRIMVEYSSPNTNKPLHLGHGRNNFLGMSVSKLLENEGYEVIKSSIYNDRGLHICKSMVAYQMFGEDDTPEKSALKGDHFVGKYYTMFGQKAKEDPKLEEMAKEMLLKWENGDKEILKLWKRMNAWYYAGVIETYRNISSKFDKYYYESETYKEGKEIVQEALKKGVVYRKEDGAVAIDLTEEGLDEKILLRGDGTSLYIIQDIYTAVKRFEEYDLGKLIYVVGNEQDYHFKVLFKILEKLGYSWAEENKHLTHLSYGMVTIPGGKLKSREGTKVDLDDLIENLKILAMAAIKEKNEDIENYSAKDLEERAMKIGLAALKFMLLKVSPEKDVFFNPKEAISFEGDTGPYILYSLTRIKSILRKSEKAKNKKWSEVNISDEEMRLGKLIAQFPEILKKAALEYNPSRVANFLLEISAAFNSFYHLHKVIEAETEDLKNMRLLLIQAAAFALEKGLEILGIEAVEKM